MSGDPKTQGFLLRHEEDAGAVEHYANPALYDRVYRHRRADVNFYRMLADERLGFGAPSPILELACGSGRLTVPLLRDGHRVVGLDRSEAMLEAASSRVQRLPATRRKNALLLRADMRAFALKNQVSLVVAAFHSLQHLVSDEDLLTCFSQVRRSLRPDGWFVFDVLPPHPQWLDVLGALRWSRRSFLDPSSGRRLRHGTSHRYDAERKALHMQLHYQEVNEVGAPVGKETIVRLCHRQFWPGDLDELLARAGLKVLARYSDFAPSALETKESLSASVHEHVYVARPTTAR